jgi:hypothetical protein
MGLLGRIIGGTPDPDAAKHLADQQKRDSAWQAALDSGRLPDFVTKRLADTRNHKLPWVSTTSVGSLMAMRTHGIRPIGMVSGNCWFNFGFSWTKGHSAGWHTAIERMVQEAGLLGANAVIDVRMKVSRLAELGSEQMDFAVYGTAVAVDSLPPSKSPLVATVSALEFVRLLEAGIVPVGLAIGAHYDWLYNPAYRPMNTVNSMIGYQYQNAELTTVSQFVNRVRQAAYGLLASDGARLGTGVLARTQFSELLYFEPEENNPGGRCMYRHIAMGTAVQHEPGMHRPVKVKAVFSVQDKPMRRSLEISEEVI